MDRLHYLELMCKKTIFLLTLTFSVLCFGQKVNWSYQSEINTHGKNVHDVIYSPYRQWLALSTGENIYILDALGHEIFTTKRAVRYGDICFTPDEKYLLIRNWRAAGDLAFLELNTLVIKNVVHKESFMDASSMYFIGDYQHLLFESKEGMSLFSVNDRCELNFLQEFHTNPKFDINRVAISDDGSRLLIYETGRINLSQNNSYDGFDVFLYHLKDERYVLKDSIDNNDSYNFIEFVPGTKRVIASIANGYNDREPYLASLDCDGNKIVESKLLSLEVDADYGSISPDGKWLLTSGRGMAFYEINKNELIIEPEKFWYHRRPHIMQFSPDGKHLLTFQSDRNLVQWNIDGVDGDVRSKLYGTIGIDFSPAFKEILSGCTDCFNSIDQGLLAPRDEFEKSEQFEKRRNEAKYAVLAILQKELEEQHAVTHKGKKYLNAGYLLGYNADREVFKAKILGEEVAVRVPLKEAKSFKEDYSKCLLGFSKREMGAQQVYEDFYVLNPKTGKRYNIFFKRNPFDYQSTSKRSQKEKAIYPITADQPIAISSDSTSQTYALIISTNEYKEFGDLVNPILDGETIAKELSDNYAVQTDVLINPTLLDLKMKLRAYAERGFNKKDQLLIFVAGHGHFDPIYKEGYLVVADSRLNDEAQISYLSHSSLKTIVKNIPCEHILLVMDVCFGGTFDQDVATGHRGGGLYGEVNRDQFVERKMQYKTRLYITSGGNRYVPDGRPGQHSPFARNFLEALRSYGGEDKVLTTGEIMQYLEKSEVQPHFGEFTDNEPGSDFLLISE